MINDALYSSKSDEWATPDEIYKRLDEEFNFTLDPCSTDENHKCANYFTKEDDGLKKQWGGREYFAIHHIAKSVNGLKRHIGNQEMIIL